MLIIESENKSSAIISEDNDNINHTTNDDNGTRKTIAVIAIAIGDGSILLLQDATLETSDMTTLDGEAMTEGLIVGMIGDITEETIEDHHGMMADRVSRVPAADILVARTEAITIDFECHHRTRLLQLPLLLMLQLLPIMQLLP
jgi:hypothetical protein